MFYDFFPHGSNGDRPAPPITHLLAHVELGPLLGYHVVLLLVELPPVGQLPPQLLELYHLLTHKYVNCAGSLKNLNMLVIGPKTIHPPLR
jgi:hypothetical protein